MRTRTVALAALAAIVAVPAAADSSSGWFAVPANAVFSTGDSWTSDGVAYRLYGVQSCLRGTSFTNAHGVKRDCGEASLAMLIAYVRDLRPQCARVAEAPDARTIFVFCVATPTIGAAAGSRIDLGTALISTGFAFPALTPEGKAVHPPYLAAELVAQKAQAGLWAFADLPEPNGIILRALKAREAAAAGSTGSANDRARP